jgi:glyoxylase-like metal-dependent hydrolase (beta-lactamase superfamily II)
MEPTGLIEFLDGVARWSVWNEPRKLWFNGHLLRVGEAVVAIDPVPFTEEVATAISAWGVPALCVVTNRDHERAADALRTRWGARVLVPWADAQTMTLVGDDVIGDGDELAGALRVVAVKAAKSPGELAIHWPARRILVLGDAAIGRPAGALSMLPAEKLPDLVAARAGVARLADLEAEVVLVGDGDDLLSGGSAALRALDSIA